MKARAFDYVRASSLEAAFAAFATCEGDARYLAGGQSLLAALNLRLDAPDLLIDIAHIPGLRGIELRGGHLRIGALTRHADVLASPLVQEHAPLFSTAAAYVAHPAIRNKGTMGGSLALADPASEFPAVALALDGLIEISNADGTREVAAADFFRDLYETALEPGELITALNVPVHAPGRVYAFQELARRRGDYAIVGLAAALTVADGIVSAARLSFFSVGPTAIRTRKAEAVLTGSDLTDATIAAAKAALAEDLSPDDDVHVASETRMHLARVILGRALDEIRAAPARSAVAA